MDECALPMHAGPINTMLLNGREVGRAILCSFDLAFNQTKTYMSLRLVPVIDILYQLQVCISVIDIIISLVTSFRLVVKCVLI